MPIGLVLAGGRATRLGGGDKPLMVLGGRTILGRIADRLGPQCDGLLLSAGGDPARFAPWPVVADHPEDAGRGPLAGLLAGLDWVAVHRPSVASVVSLPGDTPFPPADLVARLTAGHATSGRPIAVARSAGRTHHLVALWPVALRDDLRMALRNEGMRRVADFGARHGVVAIDWTATPSDPFLNINTPDDLRIAEAFAT